MPCGIQGEAREEDETKQNMGSLRVGQNVGTRAEPGRLLAGVTWAASTRLPTSVGTVPTYLPYLPPAYLPTYLHPT